MAGLPALHGSEPGQVRKEAATAIFCKCRGSGSPPILICTDDRNRIGSSRFCSTGGWKRDKYRFSPTRLSLNNHPLIHSTLCPRLKFSLVNGGQRAFPN